MPPDRRRFLAGSLAAAGAGMLLPRTWAQEPPPPPAASSPSASPGEDALNVRQFGATGDGETDDAGAIQHALDEAGRRGGAVVELPRGDYLLRSPLEVPKDVTLQGVFRAPTARTQRRGSCLLAVADKGNAEGTPLISLHENSTLAGLCVFYPEQTCPDPPVEYPWTVRQLADNASLIDVLLVNPWRAVDLGTVTGGRHYVRGLYAQPLLDGIFVDRCFDVGRIADVHFWPFWKINRRLQSFTEAHTTGFRFGRTDWQCVTNCFGIHHKIGYHFVRTDAGTPNVVLTNSGSDEGPLAVQVDACQAHAGLSFVNGQFMAGVRVGEGAAGPVKFTACGFWGGPGADTHAVLDGPGPTTFTACHFTDWARRDPEAPAIVANCGSLTVNGCQFLPAGKRHFAVGPEVRSTLIYGNTFAGPVSIRNDAGSTVRLDLNAEI